MKPISYDEAQTEQQKKIAEMIRVVWDAGYKQGIEDGKERK